MEREKNNTAVAKYLQFMENPSTPDKLRLTFIRSNSPAPHISIVVLVKISIFIITDDVENSIQILNPRKICSLSLNFCIDIN